MKILVTGGEGYCGSVLVPKLLAAGHFVTTVDALWFGTHNEYHKNSRLKPKDIRDGVDCTGQEVVIHLAGIANDPCGELDAKLTWEVNVLATMQLAESAVSAGVKQFIFASSASVYGLKGDKAVVETDSLTPVSDYNKTKQVAERVLLSYSDGMAVQIVRPATICGMSPRMRLDTVVNMLTVQALTTGKIVAHCGPHGAQLMRPNTHIEDICSLYCWLLEQPAYTVTYNAGFENLSVGDTAELICKAVPAEVTISEVPDKRSYCVDSSKLLAAGFAPKHSVAGAVREIAEAYKSGALKIEDRCINLSWMRQQGLVRDVR